MTRRTAQGALPGLRRRATLAAPAPLEVGVRYLIVSRRRVGPVRVLNGRVDAAGTSPDFQRLIGLSAAALRAYAAAHGWRIVETSPTGRMR